MKPKLRVEVVHQPHPEAEACLDAALDHLADVLADRIIARARRDVAREAGVEVDSLDREHGRHASAARAAWLAPRARDVGGR